MASLMSRLLMTVASPCSVRVRGGRASMRLLVLRTSSCRTCLPGFGLGPHSKTVRALSMSSSVDGALGAVVEQQRCGGVVGGDEHTLDATRVGLRVAEAERDGLADLALEVRRGAQRALEAGAGDLERVVAGDRVVVVEFARDQTGRQRQRVESDAALGPGGVSSVMRMVPPRRSMSYTSSWRSAAIGATRA